MYPNSLDDKYYINKGGIENKGIEISFINKFFGWNINTSLDYNKSVDIKTKLEQGRRPNKSINIVAIKSYGKFNNRVQIIGKSKAWDSDNEKGGRNSGYGLLHLGTSYKYNNKTKLSLNINNAFDKDYTVAKGYNQLGRTINLGVSYNF